MWNNRFYIKNIVIKDSRINTLRNNVKRARTPKINKIPSRCFDRLKYSNNDNTEENNNNIIINRVEKIIDYGNNYLKNLNQNNRTMINNSNNNSKRLYTKQVENKNVDKTKTINNTYRNKSEVFSNYLKKK